jgi:TatD DNase family protein
MRFPEPTDFIDIHTHEAKPAEGIFALDVLMVHEDRLPGDTPGIACTAGIHPWFLDESNHRTLLEKVDEFISYPSVVAVGEAGFDKIKGPALEIQRFVFEKQVAISESRRIPVVIHCVRAWDELLMEHKKLKPEMPWLVHGFRGNRELAMQLIKKGMYISFWFDYILRSESSELIRNLPVERIFLETDGADVDIRDIYIKISADLGITVEKLKHIIYLNYKRLFSFEYGPQTP